MNDVAEFFSNESNPGKELSWRGKKEIKEFLLKPRCKSFVETGGAFEEVSDVKKVYQLLPNGSKLFRVTTAPLEASCAWEAKAPDGRERFVTLKILLKTNPARFVKKWASDVEFEKSLSSSTIANRLSRKLKSKVDILIQGRPFDELTEKLWERFFKEGAGYETLQTVGLKFAALVDVQYLDPTLDRRRELEKYKEERRLLNERKEFDAMEETRSAEIDAEKNERLRQIEHNAKLGESDREKERRRLEEEARERKMKFEGNASLWRLKNRKERLEIKAEIMKIKNRPNELREILEELRRVNENMETFAKEKDRFFQAFQIARESDSEPSIQLAAQLGGASDATLCGLGLRDSKEFFSRYFNAKVNESPSQRVNIDVTRAKRVKTRSVGDTEVEVLTFKINDKIQLKFTAPIDGYLSILNLGTNQDYVLLVPNGELEPGQTFIRKGEVISLPSDNPGDCIEELGPPGWEEIVVLISKEPLFDDKDRRNVAAPYGDTFAKLSTEQLRRLLGRLATLDADDWAVGTIGFNVVEA